MPRPLATLAAGALALVAVTACSSHDATPTVTATATHSATTTATQTATATKTASATATATQTTTATASASASSAAAATSTDSAAPALTQRYCIPSSKLCFRYPDGYQIVKDPQPRGVLKDGQFGHLADPQGNPLLYFSYTASGALAGAEPENAPTHRVIRAEKTAAVADRYGDTLIYASAVAVTEPGKGYFLRQFLTTSEMANKVGTFQTAALADGSSSVEYPEFKPENMLTLTTRNWDATVARYYATPEEAAQQLETPAAALAYQILRSATTA